MQSLRLACVALLLGLASLNAQQHNLIEAEENFRLGVNTFHSGLYQQALIFFERSLALLKNSDSREHSKELRMWLGRTYYHNGDTAQALKTWLALIKQNQASNALKSLHEIVNSRYSLDPEPIGKQLALFGRVQSTADKLFKRPTALVQSPHDSLRYLVDFAGNAILMLDINGRIVDRLRGTIQNIYHSPYDIIFNPEGGFIVSDYGSNQLLFHDHNGTVYQQAGTDLLGPQYLASTNDGYFYVSDWGHRRIVKWDFQGNQIFSFGNRSQSNFAGLSSPTGIAVLGQSVFVADNSSASIYVFDHDGGYQNTLLSGQLREPEGLLISPNQELIIADKNEIKLYNLQSRQLSTLYRGGEKSKYYHLSYDQNRNLMASDFLNSRVDLLVEQAELYNNLFVEIRRISSKNFPQITVDIKVESHQGQPIKNLRRNNFVLFEDNRLVSSARLQTRADDLHLVLVGGGKMLLTATQKIEQQLLEGDTFKIIHNQELLQVYTQEQLKEFVPDEQTPPAESGRSLNMGSQALLQQRGKRILIYLLQPGQKEEFAGYGLAEIAQLLANNSIHLLVLGTGAQTPGSSLQYLLEQNSGDFIPLEESGTLATRLAEQRRQASSIYHLSYRYPKTRVLQNLYIESAVIVNYGQRSGRDESGFFLPE